jgi:glyoxalase/bleomycin resistance protein/dioxygenase superfamily protein
VKKFFNHIDHIAWISWPRNLDANIARLEQLADTRLTRFERKELGIIICANWEAGLEILAPSEQPTTFNQALRDWLEKRGEGVMSVVFGVRDLNAHAQRLRSLGIEVGPELDDHPASPWHDQFVLRERVTAEVMNSQFVLGDIHYADELIKFGDVTAA